MRDKINIKKKTKFAHRRRVFFGVCLVFFTFFFIVQTYLVRAEELRKIKAGSETYADGAADLSDEEREELQEAFGEDADLDELLSDDYVPDTATTADAGKTSGQTTGAESGSTEAESVESLSQEILQDDHGRVTFWEWEKVTLDNVGYLFTGQNVRVPVIEKAGAGGEKPASLKDRNGRSEYRASMFVILDENLTPKGFLSTYADSDHVFNTNFKAKIYDEFPNLGNGNVDVYTKLIGTIYDRSETCDLNTERSWADMSRTIIDRNGKSTYIPFGPVEDGCLSTIMGGTRYMVTDTRAGMVLKADSDGNSVDFSNFSKDKFLTSGSSKGVLWVSTGAALDALAGWSCDGRTVTKRFGTVYANIALSRASMKNNSGDMSYNSIGKKLNGNVDYFIGTGSGSNWFTYGLQLVTEPWEYGYKKDSHNIMWPEWTEKKVKNVPIQEPLYTDTAYWSVEKNSSYASGREEISAESMTIVNLADSRDTWVIRSENPYNGGYICYRRGWIACYTDDFWNMYYSGSIIPDIYSQARNALRPVSAKQEIYGYYKWYVGTPHVFACVKGEGGDKNGNGSTVTIKNGQVYIVSGAEYMDADGNEAISDGVVLPEGSSIVIEEGGVLSVEDNFINNGRIINKGGTIIVKDGGCISPFADTKEGIITCTTGASGRSGDIIVMPGGKLFCLTNEKVYNGNLLSTTKTSGSSGSTNNTAGSQIQGTGFMPFISVANPLNKESNPTYTSGTISLEYALSLTGGSCLINYGTVVMSSAQLDAGSKIENRKDGAIHIGYNRTDNTVLLADAKATNGNAKAPFETLGQITQDPSPIGLCLGVKSTIYTSGSDVHSLKGTIVNEKTATLDAKRGNLDFASANQVEIITPEY